MPKVRYVGPHTGVDVETAPAVWSSVARDSELDVSDELAASLLEQPSNWEAVTTAAPKTPKEG